MTGAFRYHWDWATCRRIWHWFPVVGRAERALSTIAPACVRTAALALPLALPGAAFLPAGPAPMLGGPAFAPYSEGSEALFGPGVFVFPLEAAARQGLGRNIRNANGLADFLGAQELGYPVTLAAPHDVAVWLPDRAPTDVPEAPSWAMLAVAVVGAIYARLTQRRQMGA